MKITIELDPTTGAATAAAATTTARAAADGAPGAAVVATALDAGPCASLAQGAEEATTGATPLIADALPVAVSGSPNGHAAQRDGGAYRG